MNDNAILPDFALLSSDQLEAWLVLYARAMTMNCVDDLPAKLIEFVQSDPKIMARLNDIYEQIIQHSDSFQPYHLVASPDTNIHTNHQPETKRKNITTPTFQPYAIAAAVAILILTSLSVYLYLRPQFEPTENIALQNKIDSLNREITSLQIKKLKDENEPPPKDSASKIQPSPVVNEEAFFASQKIKFHHEFQTDQTKELMIADAFASRGGNEPTVENPFEVKVFSPNKRAINEVNFRWEGTKNKQKYTEPIRLRLYNNQKKLKDLSLNAPSYRLTKADGLTDGLYYWTLETEDQQIFIGKFEFFTR